MLLSVYNVFRKVASTPNTQPSSHEVAGIQAPSTSRSESDVQSSREQDLQQASLRSNVPESVRAKILVKFVKLPILYW
jgi:hypothetical protein